ncbi:NAD(P)-dependent oxidoreductase [Microbacterium aoyamense]|uniref:NAD(P)-dependent oxidoreductase n=2 Tax=Microbacterium aoyamense TaxID=344166 RepID=A0ABN2PBA8_9MICO
MMIGFIGLGAMGARMVHNLVDADLEVVIHDLDRGRGYAFEERGATWAESTDELGRQCDVVFTSLPGPQQMREVAFDDRGLLSSLRSGAAWFDLTTNAPSTVREVSAAALERGIHVLDAPVSGRPDGARTGKLAIYVGGDAAVFESFKPLLDKMGDRVMYVGEVGAGNTAKLMHNAASISIRATIAEVMSLGVKAGMSPDTLWSALRQGAIGRARTFDSIGRRYLQEAYEPPSFALALADKDLRLALELADELDVPMSIARAAQADYREARERGWGDRDSQSSLALQNERAGVEIRLTDDQVERILAEG